MDSLYVSTTSQILAFPETGNYENNLNCQWDLISSDPGGRIQINFELFGTEEGLDYLIVSVTL